MAPESRNNKLLKIVWEIVWAINVSPERQQISNVGLIVYVHMRAKTALVKQLDTRIQ